MRQRRPEEIQADNILARVKAIKNMTPSQKLDYARKRLKDANINIGYQTGMLVVMIELMVYWKESDENMKDFAARNLEFFEVFSSQTPEDTEQLGKWMEELEKRTGYSPYHGVVDSLNEMREQNGYDKIDTLS